MCVSLAFVVYYCTCVFCYHALTARNNFDRAVSKVSFNVAQNSFQYLYLDGSL